MAKAEFTIKLGDIDRFRLFLWELRQLHDEMRVMASPHADRLDHLIDRFIDSDPEGDRAD